METSGAGSGLLRWLAAAGVAGLLAFGSPGAVAQSPGVSPGGTTGYVPYGASFGGFLPYRPGPAGGLGLQTRPTEVVGRNPGGSAFMGGMNSVATGPRGTLVPLRPLGLSGGMGMSDRLVRRPATMGGMTRPPVGSYPFRVPPSLIGAPSGVPGMSM